MRCVASEKSINGNACDDDVGVQKMNMKVEPTYTNLISVVFRYTQLKQNHCDYKITGVDLFRLMRHFN